MEVLRVNPSDTYPIRLQMLRPGGTIQDCHFQGDDDELTFHLGAFVDKKLVSVASFYFDRHPHFEDENQFRLRGMATLPEFQGQGLSMALLRTAIPVIKQNFCTLLWCNARASAIGFYQKVGFESFGANFEIPGIGTHQLMALKL